MALSSYACVTRVLDMRILLKDGVIHRLCGREGISRDELARRLGVSTATAYRIDDGRVDPSPKFIAALINLSGESFEELFEIVEPVEAAS